MAKITLDELFNEMRAKRLAELAAQDAEPAYQAKEAERRRLRAEQIDREIAAGLRDGDGELLVECGNECPSVEACKAAGFCIQAEGREEEDEYDPDGEPEEF